MYKLWKKNIALVVALELLEVCFLALEQKTSNYPSPYIVKSIGQHKIL